MRETGVPNAAFSAFRRTHIREVPTTTYERRKKKCRKFEISRVIEGPFLSLSI
jgi:hypothetical protein